MVNTRDLSYKKTSGSKFLFYSVWNKNPVLPNLLTEKNNIFENKEDGIFLITLMQIFEHSVTVWQPSITDSN